jgi:hypothetical protein
LTVNIKNRYSNVVLVLQSNTDSPHILPSLTNETNATSDGVCNFTNIEAEDNVHITEVFKVIHEEVDIAIKREEIPGDITFPDIKSEPDEVSYVYMSVIGHILPLSKNLSIFSMSLFLANGNSPTVGNKSVLLFFCYSV